MPDTNNVSFLLEWDKTGERLYETGNKMMVLFPMAADGSYEDGVAWNGITSVSESPSGADANPLYADDIKYLELRAAEEFGATIGAYMYPEAWSECDGSAVIAPGVTIGQQVRKKFGLCYRTTVGNDTQLDDHGYKLHLIWNATASPSERSYTSVNDSPEAVEFSYEITTTPVPVAGYKPTAHMEIDSTKVDATKLAALEVILYGTAAEGQNAAVPARLPSPDEVIAMFKPATTP